MDTLYVYRLVPGKNVIQHRPAIERALETAGFVRPTLWIAPASGFLRVFAANGEGAAPADAAKARTRAEEFMRKLKVALDRERKIANTSMPDLLPLDRLRFVEAIQVRGQGDSPDHWLVRWAMTLPTGRQSEDAAVECAIVDMRLAGTPIALVSSLRPWSEVLRVQASAPPSPAGDHVQDTGTQPVYVLGGEDQPQRFLAPFWLAQRKDDEGGHSHGVPYVPACEMSLFVGIAREEAQAGVRLGVVANDANGKLRFLRGQDGWRMRWRWFSLDDHGDVTESSGDRLDISRTGVIRVFVEVDHGKTGAYASAFLELPVNALRVDQ